MTGSGALPSREALACFHSGDTVGFRELVEQYGAAVKSVALPFATDEDDLKDLCQEIWLRVYEKRRSYQGAGPVLAWILTLARHTCISQARHRGTRSRAVQGFAAETIAIGGRPAPTPTPAAFVEAEERARALFSAVNGLPERQRMAVVLRLYYGYPAGEVSHLMGCTQSTVRSLLRHGLMNLRKNLEGRV